MKNNSYLFNIEQLIQSLARLHRGVQPKREPAFSYITTNSPCIRPQPLCFSRSV